MDWIAVDWGTTNLRAWAMARDSHVPLAEARSAEGMATLEWEDFEPALLRLISPWLGGEPTTVLACGMVGARQGWVQARYEEAPCPPLTLPFTKAPTRDPRLDVRVVGGISQSGPADVMRGEETQIAGALAHDPAFNGVICLPGTHSKWAAVLGGRIVDFQTFMTGEIFGLLSRQSVLRHGVGTEGWDEEAYAAAVAEMLEAPESLTSRLFGLRASGLLEGMTQETARARLSGMLIGTELANARERWQAGGVALIGEQGLCERYARALRIGGTRVRLLDGTEMTLRGLLCAHDMLTRTE